MTAKLNKLIDQFLSKRRKSVGGAWAPVEEEDVEQLEKILDALIDTKWQGDDHDTRPIEYTLVNRHNYHRLPYLPQLYWHQENEEGREDIFETAMFNLRVAFDELDTIYRCMRVEKRCKREEAAKS